MCVYDIIVFIYYVCVYNIFSNSICHNVRLSYCNKGYLLAYFCYVYAAEYEVWRKDDDADDAGQLSLLSLRGR